MHGVAQTPISPRSARAVVVLIRSAVLLRAHRASLSSSYSKHMVHFDQAALRAASAAYPKPANFQPSYGTAGFRAEASLLPSTVFRCGLLIGLRAKCTGQVGSSFNACTAAFRGPQRKGVTTHCSCFRRSIVAVHKPLPHLRRLCHCTRLWFGACPCASAPVVVLY